ncbi:metalloregulator ArsR/SmtB family transcription factor [Methylosinus sp. Sm6]|uniref:metalloregulator ArsR/SmtB family transcription factor n=1 Tax=Methylosinus sp. Sm6 TaxID=2866948 RepID=UPI001C995F3F|nr:metalloregulator ArsR/SmtB family transcription factor [Methylosinus sp. Sm6]MBY6240107.1 metalloregulator ArsR/SmtB family transcription factor [Methylosinus sp. Sm6]
MEAKDKVAEDRLVTEEIIGIFDALAQTTRLEAYRLLLRYLPYGLPVGDIARLLAVPHNTLSTHIAHLERAGLVLGRREGRSVIYAANSSKLGHVLTTMLADLGASLDVAHPGLALAAPAFPQKRPKSAGKRARNVLFLCSGNAARSILAEAILNREGGDRFRAFSAGSRPAEQPDPIGVELLSSLGYDTRAFRSKSWKQFTKPDAPRMDFVITLCDDICEQPSGPWPRNALLAHWGVADPALAKGDAQKRAAFMDAYRRLGARLTAFVNLPLESLDRAALKSRLADIATMEGATELAVNNAA